MNAARAFRRCLFALAVLFSLPASALNGEAELDFEEFLTTNGCGSDSAFSSAVLRLLPGRRWRLYGDYANYSGRYTADSSGRFMTLTLDIASLRRFTAGMRRAVSNMCRTPATMTSMSAVRIKVRVNRDLDYMTGTAFFSARGRTRFGQGAAQYRATFEGIFYRNP